MIALRMSAASIERIPIFANNISFSRRFHFEVSVQKQSKTTHLQTPHRVNFQRYKSTFVALDTLRDATTSTEASSVNPAIRRRRATPPKTQNVNLFLLKDYVLFPDCIAPFKIFEPRYLIMIDEATTHQKKLSESKARSVTTIANLAQNIKEKAFGVVTSSIDEYSLTKPYEVGTMANIIKKYDEVDNTLTVIVSGTKRFRIKQSDRSLLGLWEGEVEFFDDKISSSDERIQEVQLISKLTKLLQTEVGSSAWSLLESKGVIPMEHKAYSFWLCSVSPFDHEHKVELLKCTSTLERLQKIMDFYEQMIEERERMKTMRELAPPAPITRMGTQEKIIMTGFKPIGNIRETFERLTQTKKDEVRSVTYKEKKIPKSGMKSRTFKKKNEQEE